MATKQPEDSLPSSSIGGVILRLRTDRGMSRERLAELAGCHPNSIVLIERGDQSPNVDTLHKLAVGLSMKSSELLAMAGF